MVRPDGLLRKWSVLPPKWVQKYPDNDGNHTNWDKYIELYVYVLYSQRQTAQERDLNATVAKNRGSVLTPTAHDK